MIQDTSTSAYENEIRPNLGEKQAAVRRLLLAYPDGLTNAEMGKLLNWTINRVTPRVNELVHFKDKNGKPNPVIMDAGKRTCRVTGRKAHVWRLTYVPRPKPAAPPQQLFSPTAKVETNRIKQWL